VDAAEIRYRNGAELPVIEIGNGGSVAFGYGYPAETEACLVVLVQPHVAILFGGRLPACHVSNAGAAVAATGMPGIRCLFDGRYSSEQKKLRAKIDLLDQADRVHLRFKLTGA
tara:strand:+ start:380 stop:718 length:339 start_codon:yes stop_codon:yes gene_type:complete